MKSKVLVMAGLPMIAVTYGLSRFSYGLLLPGINQTLHMNQATSGIVSALSYIAYCLAIVTAMIVANKWPPRTILMIAGISAITGLGSIAGSFNAVLLGTGVFLAGLSTGFSSPPYADIVDSQIEKSKQNQVNSWINSGTSIGTALAGLTAIWLVDNWRGAYVLFMGIAILVTAVNYKGTPKQEKTKHQLRLKLSKKERGHAVKLGIAALVIGFSCSAYWLFSRDFMLHVDTVSGYVGKWFWVIIGAAGIWGGTVGIFIHKFGITMAYIMSIVALSTASLLLSISALNNFLGLLSPMLFGSAYIFMSGVLLVWGISVFQDNPSFGLGMPFFLLAFGQAIGAAVSGIVAGWIGYGTLFFGAALVGYATLLLKPDTRSKK